MNFLDLDNKNIVLMGVANRRSVAWAIGALLQDMGAKVIYVVQDESLVAKNRRLFGAAPVFICDVEDDAQVSKLAASVASCCASVDGIVHSIAYANYSAGAKPFHETAKRDFLQAVDVSCFSLISLVNALQHLLSPAASIVTMSISTTRMASENYGYMGPIKAALDSTVVFLAKSLSTEVSPEIRVNAVGPGLLKTSASAGIPGYIDSYLYAEKATFRGRALETSEAANVAAFLLSPRSSGINAQTLTVDAGMSANYFSREIVRRVVGGQGNP